MSIANSNAGLPDGWKEPGGWPLTGNVNALWIEDEPADEDDIEALEELGWTYDPATICGCLDYEWTSLEHEAQAEQIAQLLPHETVPRPGGNGSWRYKSQNLPKRVDGIAGPGIWIRNKRRAWRSEGGEAYRRVDMGDAHFDNYVMPRVKVEWDDAAKLWRRV